MDKLIDVHAYYQNQMYKVKAIDFNFRKVNLNGGDIVDLDDDDLILTFIINCKVTKI